MTPTRQALDHRGDDCVAGPSFDGLVVAAQRARRAVAALQRDASDCGLGEARVSLWMCVCACMSACVHACMCAPWDACGWVSVCMHVCMYVCVCVCMRMYVSRTRRGPSGPGRRYRVQAEGKDKPVK